MKSLKVLSLFISLVGFSTLAKAGDVLDFRASFKTIMSTAVYNNEQSTGTNGYLSIYGKDVTLKGTGVENGTLSQVVVRVNLPYGYQETEAYATDGSQVTKMGDMLMGAAPTSCHMISKAKYRYNFADPFNIYNFRSFKIDSASWNSAKTLYTVVLVATGTGPTAGIECDGPKQ